jgi:hypothetical protein
LSLPPPRRVTAAEVAAVLSTLDDLGVVEDADGDDALHAATCERHDSNLRFTATCASTICAPGWTARRRAWDVDLDASGVRGETGLLPGPSARPFTPIRAGHRPTRHGGLVHSDDPVDATARRAVSDW